MKVHEFIPKGTLPCPANCQFCGLSGFHEIHDIEGETMTIEWVDEPPRGRGNWDNQRRDETRQFAAELKRHPGRWAAWPFETTALAARAMATRISQGRTATFAEGFRAVSRGDRVYVQYELGMP